MPNRRLQNNDQAKLIRDARIWELRALNAWTQSQIAKDVGISQVAVHNVLEKQTKEYKKIYWEKIDNEKTIQIYALKKVANEMWEAWVKSKNPSKIVKQSNITDDSKGTKNIEIKESQGDPRYIELYLKALKDIRDILGINAATTTHATIVHSANDTDEQADTSLARFLDGLAKATNNRGSSTVN